MPTLHPRRRRRTLLRGSDARIIAAEWGKLLRLPALWVFLALCLAFNSFIAIQAQPTDPSTIDLLARQTAGYRQMFSDIGGVAKDLGQRMDGQFAEELASLPPTETRALLLEAAREADNVFAQYRTDEMARHAIEATGASSRISWMMEQKYARCQERIDHLAETGAALDLYAGPLTHDRHRALFEGLMRALVGEGALVGALVMLFLLGYEHQRRTAAAAYSSTVGRRLNRSKAIAAATAAVGLYALLAAASLGVYFALWNYAGIWDASISSRFNFLVIDLLARPVIPWADFTVAHYLAACVALGGVLALIGGLAANACGALIKNTYLAALAFALACLGGYAAQTQCLALGWLELYYLLELSPIALWQTVPLWFTEMGSFSLVPWQETVSAAANLAVLGGAAALAGRRFKRKDLVPCGF